MPTCGRAFCSCHRGRFAWPRKAQAGTAWFGLRLCSAKCALQRDRDPKRSRRLTAFGKWCCSWYPLTNLRTAADTATLDPLEPPGWEGRMFRDDVRHQRRPFYDGSRSVMRHSPSPRGAAGESDARALADTSTARSKFHGFNRPLRCRRSNQVSFSNSDLSR